MGSTRKQWEGHTKKTLHQLLVEMDGFEQNEVKSLKVGPYFPTASCTF